MKTRTAKKTKKPYWEMTPDELAEATKQYDKPISIGRFRRALTKKEQEKVARLRTGPVISIRERSRRPHEIKVKLDETTFRRCQDYAARHDLTISDVVHMGLLTAFRFAD